MSGLFDSLIDDVTPTLSFENVQGVEPPKDTRSASAISEQFLRQQRMPDGVRDKVEKLVEVMGHKDTALRVETIDYKIAREVFAIIPEYIRAADMARLTRAPSRSNAELLKDTLVKNAPVLEKEVVDELFAKYDELYGIYQSSKTSVQYVIDSLYAFKAQTQDKVQALKDATLLLIEDSDGSGKPRESVNVLTSNLEKLGALKLINSDCEKLRSELPYLVAKLSNQALLDMLRLTNSYPEQMSPMTYGSISVVDITRVITGLDPDKSRYTSDFFMLEQIHQILTAKYLDPSVVVDTYKLEEAYRQYDVITAQLLRFMSVKTNLESKDSVLEILTKLLDLLTSV